MNTKNTFKDSKTIKVKGRGVPLDPYIFESSTEVPETFSGSYNDLTDKPTLFSGSYADLTEKPSLFSKNYSDLIGVPSTFAPSAHNHSASDINSGVLAAARIPSLAQSKITNLSTSLSAKLTATKGTVVADSVAADIPSLVADFNSLLASLRTAGIIAV